ncbi:MAG: tetratricopeptide repeat protein [Gammaproteobacteria bacterium]|nr:tetratricopeptide repeat protein [Gammaproteobacteria bacterium]
MHEKVTGADEQYALGRMAHSEGEWEAAEDWYERAADQGHAQAQFALGMMYFDGEVEGMDASEACERAVSQCMDAAANGLERAAVFLTRDIQTGVEAYRRGDDWEAEREFRRLAEQGNAEAQFRLARMYLEHRISCDFDFGVFENACHWLRLSANHGYARAEYLLYSILAGDHVFDDYTVDPVVHVDEAQALYWKAAERPPDDQFGFGLLSESGPDYADKAEAAFWYRMAANQGHGDARLRLGLLGSCGVGEADRD